MFNKEKMEAILNKAKQIQKDVERAHAELAGIEVLGQAGAGLVSVTVSCRYVVKKVKIDPSVLSDLPMLEDLIAAAVTDANRKAEAIIQEKVSLASRDFELPSGI